MKINKKTIGDVVVFKPEGRLDASNASSFKKNIADETPPESKIVIDLSDLEFLDSSGIGTLISIHRKCSGKDGGLKFVCLHDRIRQILELTRADRLFDIYDDTETAARSFQRKQT
jgi:anti-sigma B factor antagonist